VIDTNRCLRRLISLARRAFPDVWIGFAGSLATARAVLTRWPHLQALAAARRSALTAVVAEHTRGRRTCRPGPAGFAPSPGNGRRSGPVGSIWMRWHGTSVKRWPTWPPATSGSSGRPRRPFDTGAAPVEGRQAALGIAPLA
jgi:hypothetical protein